jgi:hypothetical protein
VLKNDELRVSCSFVHSDGTPLASPPNKAGFVEQSQFIASLKRPEPDPIGHALLPKAEGALASYSGTLDRNGAEIEFEAHVRTAGTEEADGVTLRVLEIRAITEAQKDSPRHVEEAVSISSRCERQFEIHDGWLRTLDETFAFDRKVICWRSMTLLKLGGDCLAA